MRIRSLALLSLTAMVLAGCGGSSGADSSASSSSSASAAKKLTGTLTVYAAASLTDVFTGLGNQLKADNRGLQVQFNFAGSSALATQLTQGAPADVFAAANEAQMKVVTDAGLQAGDPAIFTENVLEIAVPKGNPGHVTGIADFAKPALTLAICAPEVPCGAAAQKVFRASGIKAVPDTEEEDVKAALTKVQLGEVDAALVYATDVQAVNKYPICSLKAAQNPEAARAFLDLVTSDAGQKALTAAGFRKPSA
jgi:molybdate transport system substrate-binding protein